MGCVSPPRRSSSSSPSGCASFSPSPTASSKLPNSRHLTPAMQQRLIERAAEIAGSWSSLPPTQIRALFTMLIRQIEVRPERVELQLRPARLPTILGIASATTESADEADADLLILSVAAQLRRTGKEMTLRIERRDEFPARPNPSLIKLIVRAHLFEAKLLQSDGGKFAELARREKLNRPYFARILRLTYLAPDITDAILDGRQPLNLSAAVLLNHPSLPLSWPEQRKALGFT